MGNAHSFQVEVSDLKTPVNILSQSDRVVCYQTRGRLKWGFWTQDASKIVEGGDLEDYPLEVLKLEGTKAAVVCEEVQGFSVWLYDLKTRQKLGTVRKIGADTGFKPLVHRWSGGIAFVGEDTSIVVAQLAESSVVESSLKIQAPGIHAISVSGESMFVLGKTGAVFKYDLNKKKLVKQVKAGLAYVGPATSDDRWLVLASFEKSSAVNTLLCFDHELSLAASLKTTVGAAQIHKMLLTKVLDQHQLLATMSNTEPDAVIFYVLNPPVFQQVHQVTLESAKPPLDMFVSSTSSVSLCGINSAIKKLTIKITQ